MIRAQRQDLHVLSKYRKSSAHGLVLSLRSDLTPQDGILCLIGTCSQEGTLVLHAQNANSDQMSVRGNHGHEREPNAPRFTFQFMTLCNGGGDSL